MFETFKKYFSKNKQEKTMADINPMYVGSIWKSKQTDQEVYVTNSALRMGKPYVTFSDNTEIPEHLVNQMYTKIRGMNESERLKQNLTAGSEDERIKAELVKHLGADVDFGDGVNVSPNIPPVANHFYSDNPEPAPNPNLPPMGAPDVVRRPEPVQQIIQVQAPPPNPVRVLLEGMKTKKLTPFKIDYEFTFPSEGLYKVMVDDYGDVNDDIVEFYIEKVDLESVKKAFRKSLYEYIENNYKK